MNWKAVVVIIAATLAVYCPAQETKPANPTDSPLIAKLADVAGIDSIVKALYDVISGPAMTKRDWNRMRSLFVPGARMVALGRNSQGDARFRQMTVDEYITLNGPFLEGGGFFEKEIGRKTDQFGNIAQIFSTYEAREKLEDAKPMMRGINSLQLLNDGKRWWIVSVLWQAEDKDLSLPSKYMVPASKDD